MAGAGWNASALRRALSDAERSLLTEIWNRAHAGPGSVSPRWPTRAELDYVVRADGRRLTERESDRLYEELPKLQDGVFYGRGFGWIWHHDATPLPQKDQPIGLTLAGLIRVADQNPPAAVAVTSILSALSALARMKLRLDPSQPAPRETVDDWFPGLLLLTKEYPWALSTDVIAGILRHEYANAIRVDHVGETWVFNLQDSQILDLAGVTSVDAYWDWLDDAVEYQAREAAKRMPPPAVGLGEQAAVPPNHYENAISIVQSTLRAMERTPSAASSWSEEGLRDQILVQLNGQFAGAATGETFVQRGKTDILITMDDRHVFVGECKWWSGSKAYSEAIDQLLSYLPWRSDKAALILFIDRKDASAVLGKALEVLRLHKAYKRDGESSDEATERLNFVLGHPDDTNREIQLTALFAVLPREAYRLASRA